VKQGIAHPDACIKERTENLNEFTRVIWQKHTCSSLVEKHGITLVPTKTKNMRRECLLIKNHKRSCKDRKAKRVGKQKYDNKPVPVSRKCGLNNSSSSCFMRKLIYQSYTQLSVDVMHVQIRGYILSRQRIWLPVGST